MAYPAILLLLLSGLGAACARGWSNALRVVGLAPLAIAFVALYVLVGDHVAQDRAAYYDWYQQAHILLGATEAGRDVAFTWVLSLLPHGLSQEVFGVLLAGAAFALLATFALRLAARGAVPWSHVPFVVLAALGDRLFIDTVMNTTRSGLAILLVMIAATIPSRIVALLVAALGYGMHGRAALIAIVVVVLARLLARAPRIGWAVLATGVAALLARLATGGALLAELSLVDAVLADAESEQVVRAFTTEFGLTPSLFAQALIGMLVPAAFVLLARRGPLADGTAPETRSLAMLAILALGFALCVWPDLALAQRFFIVPIVLLPALMPTRWLKLYVLAKVALTAMILPGQFP